MILKHLKPDRRLEPYIHRIWNFESNIGIPVNDLRTIAPNGRIKLVIPYRNHLKSTLAGTVKDSPEGSPILIGQTTTPAMIESEGEVGTIGIEFKPASFYRFFNFQLSDITNHVYDVNDLPEFRRSGLHQKVSDAVSVGDKVAAVEAFLLQRLRSCDQVSPIVEFSVSRILAARGLIRIDDLAGEIGYSRRHIDRLFAEKVGVNPKEFAGIVRFQSLYQVYNGGRAGESGTDRLDLYYDQSHFNKEFRRFTGLAPRDYLKQGNAFGKVFLEQ